MRKWGVALRNNRRAVSRLSLWAWADFTEILKSAREQAGRSFSIKTEMLLEDCLSSWAELIAEKKRVVNSVTAGIAGMMLSEASRREVAHRSLRPEGEKRVRILVDTNVYIDEPVEVR